MTRGNKRNRRSKEKKERNGAGLQKTVNIGAYGEQKHAANPISPKGGHFSRSRKTDRLRGTHLSSLLVKKPNESDGSANAIKENTVHIPSMLAPQKKKKRQRGKGDPAARAARHAMRRAKKAALEAAKSISIPNEFTTPIELGQEVNYQDSSELDAKLHEDSLTTSIAPETSVSRAVLIDISGYVGYERDQAQLPSQLSHLRRLASLIPRQHTSPQRVGGTVNERLGHKCYPSLAKVVDDFCSYVDHLLEQ